MSEIREICSIALKQIHNGDQKCTDTDGTEICYILEIYFKNNVLISHFYLHMYSYERILDAILRFLFNVAKFAMF
jgi:hypothetical protein